jgi:hypothetical protein
MQLCHCVDWQGCFGILSLSPPAAHDPRDWALGHLLVELTLRFEKTGMHPVNVVTICATSALRPTQCHVVDRGYNPATT